MTPRYAAQSRTSALYDPLSYHYGSVWPLFTGWVSMAAYRYGRPHVGYQALEGGPLDSQFSALLKPDQWQRLIGRLGQIENPEVPVKPSPYSLPDSRNDVGKSNGGTSGD